MLLRVQEFRQKAGLSQSALATKSCCSRELISAIECGRHDPNTARLSKIAYIPQGAMNSLNPILRIGAQMTGLAQGALQHATAYSKEVVAADFEEAGDQDVQNKVVKDFAAKGLAVTAAEVRVKMDELMAAAVAQVKAGT